MQSKLIKPTVKVELTINLFPGNYSKCLEHLLYRMPFAAPETEFQEHIFNGEYIQERNRPSNSERQNSMHFQVCMTQVLLLLKRKDGKVTQLLNLLICQGPQVG